MYSADLASTTPQMSTPIVRSVESHSKKALRLLSLDAGGPQGISQLQILVEIMVKVSDQSGELAREGVKRPYQVFDAIGGSGTGGLISMFLVILKMTAREALQEFTLFAVDIFSDMAQTPVERTDKLKRTIHSILEKYGVDKDLKLVPSSEPPPTSKLIVPIMHKGHVGVPSILRNYSIRNEPPINLTVADAMLATCATPPMFASTTIAKEYATFSYIGGDLGLSNPVREILAEAHRTFGDQATVSCLLSIGCGHPGVIATPEDAEINSWVEFLKQIAMDCEKTAQEIHVQMSQLAMHHRLSVTNGMEGLQSHGWRNTDIITARTTSYLNDLETVEALDRCVDTIINGVGHATLEQLKHSGGAKILPPSLPPLTPNFVERKAAMKFIETALFDEVGVVKGGSKRLVVTGIGGCGKTQLILKVVERHRDCFISCLFLDGNSKDTIRRDILRHVRSLGGPYSQISFSESMAFLAQPYTSGQRLLIIDNVDDPDLDLDPFLPRWASGAVIITSRSVSRGQMDPPGHLELDVMSLEESIELLTRGSGRPWPPSESDKQTATLLARALGFHPIALTQAISYIHNTGISTRTYIARLESSRARVLSNPAKNQVGMRYNTAFAAFDASYDILPPNAQKLLHLLSYFHWNNFPLKLVIVGGENEFSTDHHNYLPRSDESTDGIQYLREIFCPLGRWDPFKFDNIIATLRDHSLVTIVSIGDSEIASMHPLVHEWARLCPSGDETRFQSAAIRLLCCGSIRGGYFMTRYLFTHVQALSFRWGDLHVNDAASFSRLLRQSGHYSEATTLMEKVQVTLKRTLGVSHLSTLLASADLADNYRQLGRLTDAEALDDEVFRYRKERLGEDHLDTIHASAHLAYTYGQLGRHVDAEILQAKVVAQRERMLGEDHLETIRASANLAHTYDHLGRYIQAVKLALDVMRRRRRLLGLEHPDTILACACLGSIYRNLGRYNAASALEIDVLRRRTTLWCERHPETVHAMLSLARTYHMVQRKDEALGLAQRAGDIALASLGEGHPLYKETSTFLALCKGT